MSRKKKRETYGENGFEDWVCEKYIENFVKKIKYYYNKIFLGWLYGC